MSDLKTLNNALDELRARYKNEPENRKIIEVQGKLLKKAIETAEIAIKSDPLAKMAVDSLY